MQFMRPDGTLCAHYVQLSTWLQMEMVKTATTTRLKLIGKLQFRSGSLFHVPLRTCRRSNVKLPRASAFGTLCDVDWQDSHPRASFEQALRFSTHIGTAAHLLKFRLGDARCGIRACSISYSLTSDHPHLCLIDVVAHQEFEHVQEIALRNQAIRVHIIAAKSDYHQSHKGCTRETSNQVSTKTSLESSVRKRGPDVKNTASYH